MDQLPHTHPCHQPVAPHELVVQRSADVEHDETRQSPEAQPVRGARRSARQCGQHATNAASYTTRRSTIAMRLKTKQSSMDSCCAAEGNPDAYRLP